MLSKETADAAALAGGHSKDDEGRQRALSQPLPGEGALAAKIKQRWRNLMISPGNRRLGNFHLCVASLFVVDFFLTGFVLANHALLRGEKDENGELTQKDFLSHRSVYTVIILVQGIDIVLNFFKI